MSEGRIVTIATDGPRLNCDCDADRRYVIIAGQWNMISHGIVYWFGHQVAISTSSAQQQPMIGGLSCNLTSVLWYGNHLLYYKSSVFVFVLYMGWMPAQFLDSEATTGPKVFSLRLLSQGCCSLLYSCEEGITGEGARVLRGRICLWSTAQRRRPLACRICLGWVLQKQRRSERQRRMQLQTEFLSVLYRSLRKTRYTMRHDITKSVPKTAMSM